MSAKELPTRFHIGTQKAGSTFLYNLLASHPDIALSSQSEVHYYYKYFDRGDDWYKGLFPESGICIDTSPKYFMNAEIAAKYIYNAVGEKARFLLILRNPVDFINSHYQMHVISDHFVKNKKRYPVEPKNVVDCIKRYPEFLKQAQYGTLLAYWLKYFDINQFKIISFEEFVASPQVCMEEILCFWDLSPVELTAAKTSKNRMLKNKALFKLRGFIMKHPFLKHLLQKNPFVNWLYENFLTQNSRNKLSQKHRQELAQLLENEVRLLEGLIPRKSFLWPDFN